ncbi:hypothetical protein DFH09DRAFT_1067438 [Mycena vulgaris]|nr:hypothetical protein DFH09DRAFT_1067438 [Mycena vulgaris]
MRAILATNHTAPYSPKPHPARRTISRFRECAGVQAPRDARTAKRKRAADAGGPEERTSVRRGENGRAQGGGKAQEEKKRRGRGERHGYAREFTFRLAKRACACANGLVRAWAWIWV